MIKINNNKSLFLLSIFFCFSFADELFFLDTFGFSGKTAIILDTEVVDEDGESKRKTISMENFNFAILIKGKHRINFGYYRKSDLYNGFNLPYSSSYYVLGTNHYIKNKTRLNLNFNIEFKYISEKFDLYDNMIIGFGVSRENDSKDFDSYSHLTLYFQKPSEGKTSMLLKLDYPIYMRVLPTDNIASKQSYLFTPSIILDKKDVYLSLAFSISHNF